VQGALAKQRFVRSIMLFNFAFMEVSDHLLACRRII
jgi:hypothetical protein